MSKSDSGTRRRLCTQRQVVTVLLLGALLWAVSMLMVGMKQADLELQESTRPAYLSHTEGEIARTMARYHTAIGVVPDTPSAGTQQAHSEVKLPVPSPLLGTQQAHSEVKLPVPSPLLGTQQAHSEVKLPVPAPLLGTQQAHSEVKLPVPSPLLGTQQAHSEVKLLVPSPLLGKAKVLYGIATCSAPGFPEIVDAVFDTWGQRLPRAQLVIAGGLRDDATEGLVQEATPCGDKSVDFWCKEAVLLWRAAQRAATTGAKWLCVSQEDKYIWTAEVDTWLSKHDASRPSVIASYGCAQDTGEIFCDAVTKLGSICGGPTYFLSRGMLEGLVKGIKTQAEFLKAFRGANGARAITGASDVLSTCFFYSRFPDGNFRQTEPENQFEEARTLVAVLERNQPGHHPGGLSRTLEGRSFSSVLRRFTESKMPLTLHLNQQGKGAKLLIPPYMREIHASVFTRPVHSFAEFPHARPQWQSAHPFVCEWQNNTLTQMQKIKRLHGRIQSRADSHGFCQTPKGVPNLYIFSVDEAMECLAGREIAMAGDRHSAESYHGLMDILLNNIANKPRQHSAASAIRLEKALDSDCKTRVAENSSFTCPRVKLQCATECAESSLCGQGRAAQGKDCCQCLKRMSAKADAVIFSNSMVTAREELNAVLLEIPKLIYQIGPAHANTESKKSPNTSKTHMNILKQTKVPVLDLHSMSMHSLSMSSRDVSRMNGQMMLNMLCKTKEEPLPMSKAI